MKRTEGRKSRTVTGSAALAVMPIAIWAALAPSGPLWARLVRAAIAAVFLLGAFQSVERWIWPERARLRARSFSESGVRKVRIARTVVKVIAVTEILAAGVLRWIVGGPEMRDFATDLLILSAVWVFVDRCLQELVAAV